MCVTYDNIHEYKYIHTYKTGISEKGRKDRPEIIKEIIEGTHS